MAKREIALRNSQALAELEKITKRTYSEAELRDFHQKIQRFWDEPREINAVVFGRKIDGQAQKFRHEDLHVAYGAARKVQHGTVFVYQYNSERYAQFNNLWSQYEDWRKKQDWIEGKRGEELDKLAEQSSEQVPF